MNRNVRIKQVDVFTNLPFNGISAGVVTDAKGLNEDEMRCIAMELNVPVTAFLTATEVPEADYRVRFFTPQKEIELSEHATVAMYHALVEEGRIWVRQPEITLRQQTGAGILAVELYFANGKLQKIMMSQVLPRYKAVDLGLSEITRVLGISECQINPELPAALVYTGLWHLIVPIHKREAVDNIKPDYDQLKKIISELGLAEVNIFTMETVDKESTVTLLGFSAQPGSRQYAMAGTANGALGCYLVKNSVVEVPTGKVLLVAEQEFLRECSGKVTIEITVVKENISAVRVGGTAITVMDGIVRF